MPEHDSTIHEVTIQSVRRAADSLRAAGVDPETIDLPDLLQVMVEVSASRPTDGDDGLVIGLLRLAALALLWSQSVDDLAEILAGMPAQDDEQLDAMLADIDRARGIRPTLGERSGDGS